MSWDGNINSPHTMQDEYELAQRLGATALTTDDDGQMIAEAPYDMGPLPQDIDTCPHCEGVGAYWDDQTGQPDEPNGGRMITCETCKGDKVVDTRPCIACGAPSYDHDEGCPLAATEEVRS